MSNGAWIFWGLVAFGTAFGIARGYLANLRENAFNVRLRASLDERDVYLDGRDTSFKAGFLKGRLWLAALVAEAEYSRDWRDDYLLSKPHPARKSAAIVSEIKEEKRELTKRVKFLEYQLRSYKEYFPFLADYEDLILDEAVELGAGKANQQLLDETDPVLRFVPKAEFDLLPLAKRNQLALDRYLSGGLSPLAIGRLYERYIGYLYERDGWAVDYHGIVKGLEDLGRDLICTLGNEVHVVQVKCWAKDKTIHEKHIFQLFGTTQLYLMSQGRTELFPPVVTARFITSTALSPVARQAAAWLKIQVKEGCVLDKSFPMIKCNINHATKEKIYHLPFDQQYDRAKIVLALGERYAATAAEAESMGFRRAFRHVIASSDA